MICPPPNGKIQCASGFAASLRSTFARFLPFISVSVTASHTFVALGSVLLMGSLPPPKIPPMNGSSSRMLLPAFLSASPAPFFSVLKSQFPSNTPSARFGSSYPVKSPTVSLNIPIGSSAGLRPMKYSYTSLYKKAPSTYLMIAAAITFSPLSFISRGTSLNSHESWLFTSSWNCENSLITGFLAPKIVGMAPFDLSAITPAANSSASESAISSDIPRFTFCKYLARTMESAVNVSMYSIGLLSVSLVRCPHVFISGSLPLRFVRNVLLPAKPSSVL